MQVTSNVNNNNNNTADNDLINYWNARVDSGL